MSQSVTFLGEIINLTYMMVYIGTRQVLCCSKLIHKNIRHLHKELNKTQCTTTYYINKLILKTFIAAYLVWHLIPRGDWPLYWTMSKFAFLRRYKNLCKNCVGSRLSQRYLCQLRKASFSCWCSSQPWKIVSGQFYLCTKFPFRIWPHNLTHSDSLGS